jgi:putative effector of murein hydrolase LrgA (UPF0299 family)
MTMVLPRQRPGALIWVLRILGAVLLAAMAWIHLDLWEAGYRTIEVIGPAFLFNAVCGIGLAVLLLVSPRSALPWVAVLAATTAAGTMTALFLATTVGLFGFQETQEASLWWESVWVEVSTVVVLVTLAVLTRGRRHT